MGFPLAGGPDDDVSKLLSRDLFQQHLEKARSHAIGLGNNLDPGPQDGFADFFESDLFNPFLNPSGAHRLHNRLDNLEMGTDDELGFLGHESTTKTLKAPKLDGSNDGLFLNDSEPLFKKLRESERNRMMK